MDTVTVIIDTLYASKPDANALAIISETRDFYDSSWNKLVWFIGIIGFLLGVVFPILYSRFQQKNFKREVDEIKALAEKKIEELTIQQNEFENKFKKYIPILDELYKENERKNQIIREEYEKVGLSLNDDAPAEVISKIISRFRSNL